MITRFMKKTIYTRDEVFSELEALGNEYVKVQNPDYIHPAFEFYPLAEKNMEPVQQIQAVLMDMDGTTTTTEELCIHSLEYMIRKLSGRISKDVWAGLDNHADYPHIIGNSTTKHVEYLCEKYSNTFIPEKAVRAFIYAALWTLLTGKDKQRQDDVRNNLVNLGLSEITADKSFTELVNSGTVSESQLTNAADALFESFGMNITTLQIPDYVRLGIDVYYQRYHHILERIKAGESVALSRELFANPDKHLIEPMPGVEIFLPLVKGWLGTDILNLYELLIKAYEKKSGAHYSLENQKNILKKLERLSLGFVLNPVKVAIVTSSIYYEADIVVSEVFKILCSRIEKMNLPDKKIDFLLEKFSRYQNYYDSFVTASDSSEIRLKPHRDLYSIALHQLGMKSDQFKNVVGFEDSESGTIAIRAAGIGRCVAVPFAQTSGHNFAAASHVCKGGLPEVLLYHSLFTAL